MTLLQSQFEFVKSLNRFFTWLELNGYEATLGEAYRTPEQAKIYAQAGKGIENSLHCIKLAIDLNIFKDSVLLTTVEDLRDAGSAWESFSVPGIDLRWGGRFKNPDCDHFSLAYGGRA